MRSTEFRWSQVRVGLFVALTGIVIFASVVYVGLAGTPFARRAEVHAHFEDVAGLAVGSPVEMGGVVVGEISGLDLPEVETGLVPVTLALEYRALDRLGKSSVAFNASHALVGQRYVGLTPRRPDEEPLEPGAVIQTRKRPDVDVILERATRALEDVSALAGDLRRVSGSFVALAERLDNQEGTLGRLLNDEQIYEDLAAAAKGLRLLSETATKGEGALATLLSDEAFARDLKEGVGALSRTVRDVREGKGMLGRLTREGPGAKNLDRTMANLATVSERLADAEGTLGALISDPALLRRMNALVSEMDRLLADVRRHPQRYLKIEAF